MKKITIETTIERNGLIFFDAEDAPFKIYGVFKENGVFCRMPEEIAKKVSVGVYELYRKTAGGRVRFITDSPYVAIKVECKPWKKSHFSLTGSVGLDMYSEYDDKVRYEGTFRPPYDVENSFENVIDFDVVRERIVTVNFPLYSNVDKLYIGIKENSILKEAPEYRISKPVVYYGSSITQGGCASKPGSSYQSILSRRFNCDYINLGFARNAKGEDEMVDYIKGLDMSIFVLDYDHNANSTEHLAETHNKMFRAIRAEHPNLPIVILPRPKYYLNDLDKERFKVVENTYLEAKARGDENVYFITGKKLMEIAGDNGTVDGVHPSDSGFLSMAYAIGEVFEEIIKKNNV